MKNLLLISLLCLLISTSMFSQHKNELGMIFLASQYLPKGDLTYETVENRLALGFGLTWARRLGDSNFAIRPELLISRRVSHIETEFSTEGRSSESILQIPVFISMQDKHILDKTYDLEMAFGPNFTIISEQESLFPEGTTIPESYDKKVGFGKYFRIGIIMEFRYNVKVAESHFLLLGMRPNIDLATIGKNESEDFVIPQKKLELALYFGFIKRW